tara:strand:+ start:256 stop:726 length:471 start_codon:yes stop_codon:yes gene_type:complete
MKNILGSELQICSTNPMTGYERDGYCKPNKEDRGKHLVCGLMDTSFLDFTARMGNDLRSVVKEGEKWCLCEDRWKEAYDAGKAPYVIKEASHINTNDTVKGILDKEGFQNRNNDVGNIFLILGALFFVDLYCFKSKFIKSLLNINFKKIKNLIKNK